MSSAGQPRTLAGRYRLDEVIGRGGMSTVYRATDLSLDREVAVKVAMDPLLERDPVYAARFKREARAAASLNNPGVVTVFDAGSDGPTRYIVMEYVEGRDLSDILRDAPDHRLEPARAVRIAEPVADTLAAAHAAGIIHRDIKPGNVMVTPQGQVKVLDFGIARTTDGVTLTQTASVLGTAPYMSPEQAMGQPADARSDIYSLGCVLYEMLTGTPPFMGEVAAAVLHQHVRVAPKRPSERNPDVPPALDALVLEMLAKAPADRPQSAVEVRDRLATLESATEATMPLPAAAPVAATEPLPAAEALAAGAVAAAHVPQIATVPEPVARVTEEPPPTRRTPPAGGPTGGAGPWLVLVVIAVLLLGAAVAYALTSGGSGTSSSTTSHSTAHSAPPATHSQSSTSHSTSTPSTSSSSSTSSSTPTTTSSTTTTTTTTTPTTTLSTPGPPAGAPGPPGGVPPGQAKKGKGKGP